MNDSILTSIKNLLGIVEDDTSFDAALVLMTNTVFSILYDMGIGTLTPFTITGSSEKWTDFLEDKKDMEMVKTYVFMKVKMMFAPPESSAVIESMNRMIEESEWRLHSIENFNRRSS